MGTNPLRKNRGNDASHKLKRRIFCSFFPQAVTVSIRTSLMSKYASVEIKLTFLLYYVTIYVQMSCFVQALLILCNHLTFTEMLGILLWAVETWHPLPIS